MGPTEEPVSTGTVTCAMCKESIGVVNKTGIIGYYCLVFGNIPTIDGKTIRCPYYKPRL